MKLLSSLKKIPVREASDLDILEADQLWLGLNDSPSNITSRIKRNIQNRSGAGLTAELIELEKQGLSWHSQAATTTGLTHWKKFLDKKITKKQAVEYWFTQEKQYAKRQLTWFKKQRQINWITASSSKLRHQVEELINPWYI